MDELILGRRIYLVKLSSLFELDQRRAIGHLFAGGVAEGLDCAGAGAVMVCSIFMASRISSGAFFHLLAGWASRATTLPGIGAVRPPPWLSPASTRCSGSSRSRVYGAALRKMLRLSSTRDHRGDQAAVVEFDGKRSPSSFCRGQRGFAARVICHWSLVAHLGIDQRLAILEADGAPDDRFIRQPSRACRRMRVAAGFRGQLGRMLFLYNNSPTVATSKASRGTGWAAGEEEFLLPFDQAGVEVGTGKGRAGDGRDRKSILVVSPAT